MSKDYDYVVLTITKDSKIYPLLEQDCSLSSNPLTEFIFESHHYDIDSCFINKYMIDEYPDIYNKQNIGDLEYYLLVSDDQEEVEEEDFKKQEDKLMPFYNELFKEEFLYE